MTLSIKNTQAISPNNVPSSSKVPSLEPKKNGRRGTKRKSAGGTQTGKDVEAPMFLRKAFFIINTVDPEIASWSKDGLSFVVKDVDRFETEVIPKCFKHNHFTSFVRQLNFYGFRKLRDEQIEIENVDQSMSKWCHFRHPQFQRGRPELLKEITKNTNKEAAEKTELEALRSEVKDLKAQIKNLKSDMGILASLVGDLSKQVHNGSTSNSDKSSLKPPSKKQRLATTPSPLSVSPFAYAPVIKPEPLPPQRIRSREVSHDTSVVSLTTEDEEFLASLFEETEGDFENLPDEVVSA